eukprot:CAMPEP_0181494610 /NCGR_PEP_ID=MMETSP1110-20121109/51871_1 /TAXON_ID=174948 /ORGANISM="Symbiodinium sp., Strain CCMP421" /LENGTH=49 /DNA_ID=CAMNT_0023622049 /DNA_START=44 /DNA_END=193 /DNA_ORIENTATION=+
MARAFAPAVRAEVRVFWPAADLNLQAAFATVLGTVQDVFYTSLAVSSTL